jgi:hypothetical protein
VADPADRDGVEGVAHHLPVAEFAGMAGERQAGLGGDPEGGGEIGRRAGPLVAGHAEADDLRHRLGDCRPRRLDRRLRAVVPLDQRDDPPDDAVPCLGAADALGDAAEIVRPADPGSPRVVGRDEQLGVDHPLGRRGCKIGLGEFGVVVEAAEHRGDAVVGADEGREVVPGVAAVRVEQPARIDAVAVGQPADEIGRRRALDMAMQFHLRDRAVIARHRGKALAAIASSISSGSIMLVPCGPCGRPSQAATVSPMSAKVGRSPADPAARPGAVISTGTRSRVWSVPRHVGSQPWSAVSTRRSPGRSAAIMAGKRRSNASSAAA